MISPVLKIDPEFQAKIPPLTEEEFKQLEENILTAGEVYDSILTWNGTIVDGHNRWKIIQLHPETNIKYQTKEVSFANRWEAIEWMCSNQLGRRNITRRQRMMLIGEKAIARMNSHGGDRKSSGFSSRQKDDLKKSPMKTHDVIAKELGIGTKTVDRSICFVKGIKAITDISPEYAQDILSGKKDITDATVQRIVSAPVSERSAMINAVIEGTTLPKQAVPPRPTPPSSQPDAPTFSFDKPISTRTKAGQQLMSEIRTVIENQGNGEIIKPTLSVVTEMLMCDVRAMIDRFEDFISMNKNTLTEDLERQINITIKELNNLKGVLKNV